MHELGLAEDILRKIKEEAGKKGLSKVSSARVKVGASLVSDVPELKELLSKISKGTIADGARLKIDISPVKTACGSCGKDFNPKEMRLDCPECGSTDIRVTTGKELVIEEIK
jgi:hydrogenase nickel incorporation protein HypA/HybF